MASGNDIGNVVVAVADAILNAKVTIDIGHVIAIVVHIFVVAAVVNIIIGNVIANDYGC